MRATIPSKQMTLGIRFSFYKKSKSLCNITYHGMRLIHCAHGSPRESTIIMKIKNIQKLFSLSAALTNNLMRLAASFPFPWRKGFDAVIYLSDLASGAMTGIRSFENRKGVHRW